MSASSSLLLASFYLVAHLVGYERHWAEVIPTGRYGQPEDVATALLYLVAPEAGMVSGHTLMIDCGWMSVGHAL